MNCFNSEREPTARTPVALLVVPGVWPEDKLGLADDPQALPGRGKRLEQEIYLLGGVIGVDAGADKSPVGRYPGRQGWSREDPSVPQSLPEAHRKLVGPDHDRHDLCLRSQGVEAYRVDPAAQSGGVLEDLLAVAWLVLHDIQGFEGGGDLHGRWGGREDKGPRVVLYVLDHGPWSTHEAAHGGERLREGPDGEVDLVLKPEVLGGATAARPEHARGVRVVYDDPGAVLAGYPDDRRQVGHVPAHGEDTVRDDHSPTGLVRVPGEQALQVVEIVVPVLAQRAEGEPRPVVEGGMVLAVEIQDVLAPGQGGEHGQATE